MRIFACGLRAARTCGLVVCGVAMLAGCATAPADSASAIQPLRVGPGYAFFALSGRLSVRDGQRVDIATLRWERTPQAEALTLGSPLGSTVARLSQEAGDLARLRAPDREASAQDMETLVADALGATVPLRALGWWLQGLSAEANGERRTATGTAFHHNGWDIRIEEFPLSAEAPVARRIVAKQGEVTLRLVIDEWSPRP